MLGLSIGCSCTALQAQQPAAKDLRNEDALILTTVVSEDESPQVTSALSSLQDIGKIYAL